MQRIATLFNAGESLRWSGKPAPGIQLRSVDVFLIPFSLLWGGFAFFWETMAIVSHGPLLMKLWGIPFTLVGAYVIFGRFLYDAYLRSHTTYAVSNRAAYVFIDGLFPRTTVFTANSIGPIELKMTSGRSGSIHFGPRTSMGSRNYAWSIWAPDSAQFTSIENVADVYALVKEIA